MQLLLDELNPTGPRSLKLIFGKHYLNPNNLGKENLDKIPAMTVKSVEIAKMFSTIF